MKTLFAFTVDNVVDLITNSSSELFVFKSDKKRKILRLLAAIYPEYLNEYDELRTIDEISHDSLQNFISYHYNSWSNELQKQCFDLIPGFTFNEMYETVVLRWGGERPPSSYTHVRDITDETRKKYNDAIDPERKMFFLYSLDENPNYDKQLLLSQIGTRYHLG